MLNTVSHLALARISQPVRRKPPQSVEFTSTPNTTFTVYLGDGRPREVTTDANGRARVSIPAGTFHA